MQFTELQLRTALVVGEQNAANGAVITQRGGKLGDAIVSQLHGKYHEMALSRRLFYSHSPAVAMSAPATASIGNIIWNPPDSGVVLALGKWSVTYQAADITALACDLCYSAQATLPTTATASTTGCNYLAAVGIGGSKAKAYTLCTITTAPTPIYRLALFAVAVLDLGMDQCEGDFEGGIIVPPGYLVTPACLDTAAASGVTTTFWWTEIPI